MDNGIKNITLATLEARGEEAGALISMTGNMAEKIGWIADLCIQKTGGIGVVGNAGDWMLNPSSRWLVEPGEQSGHA
jgi:hypothetical protein